MEPIVRAVAVYFGLLIVMRMAGRRTLSEATTFDLVLMLIVAETSGQAILGEDYSLTGAALAVVTLLLLDIGFSLLQQRRPDLDRWLNGLPLILVDNGQILNDRLRRARVDEADILEAARKLQGLERIEQVKYAVLERGGGISIIPQSDK